MKKLILGFSLSVFAIGGFFIANGSATQRQYTPEEIANIEALTAGESGGGHVVVCNCKTNWFSPNVCTANSSGRYCGGDPCDNHDNNCR